MSRVRNSKRTARPRRRAGKPKRRMRRKRSIKNSLNPLAAYARLVRDPCHAPLAPAPGLVTPGATLERFRITNTFAAAGDGSGYVVWFPSFHGDSRTGSSGSFNMSMFKWSNPDSSVGPNNSTTLPFGFSAETTTGVAIADPVNASLAASSPFSRATTLSACLQIEWLGKLSDIQGQVAIVQNYPLSAFASNIGALGTAPTPPSVDQIFNYAATRERFSAAGHEVIWRPTNEQVVPRTAGDELYGTATKGQYKADTCFWVGETTTGTATWLSCPNPNEVYGIAIAYKGMAAGSNVQIQVNAIKTVALELSARNNQIEIPPQPEPAKMFNVDVNAMTNALSVENDMWQLGRKALSYVGIDDVSTAFGTAALTGAVYSGPTALQALSSGMRMLGMGSRTRGRLPSIH